MSITTYSELTTAISDRLGRSDFSAAQLGECIALCEARMRRTLSTLDMEQIKTDFTIDAEYVAVPPNFNSVRFFNLHGSTRRPLLFMADDTQTRTYESSGCPRYFSVVGNMFRFAPVPDGGYTATLVYYQQIPSLTSAAPSNWMLTAHPDAYLYGSLLEASVRVRDIDGASGYSKLYDLAIEQIQKDADERRWGGNGMATRVG